MKKKKKMKTVTQSGGRKKNKKPKTQHIDLKIITELVKGYVSHSEKVNFGCLHVF